MEYQIDNPTLQVKNVVWSYTTVLFKIHILF